MYTVVSAIEIEFEDVHGVALTAIWIIAAIRQNRMTLLVAIMMLITGALGLCREHTKWCMLYFLLCCTHKKNTAKQKLQKIRSATWQQCFCLRVRSHSATRSPKNCDPSIPSTARGHLKPTPPPHIRRSIVGSCCHLRPGQAEHVFCSRQTLESIPHSQRGLEREREREGGRSASAGGVKGEGVRGNVGMSGWMEWRTGHVTPTPDDRVGANAIAVIITAYVTIK